MTPLTIILPTYNEAGHIVDLIRDIQTAIQPQEVIVVDDASVDGTAAIIQKSNFSHVTVLSHTQRQGLTPSIQEGIQASKTPYIGWMDADYSHPPDVLPALFSAAKTSDIAVASLYVPTAVDGRPDVLARFFSILINKLCSSILDRRIANYTSGFLITTYEVANEFPLRGDYGEYCIDFLYRHLKSGKRIVEIPFHSQPRRSGVSKTSTHLIGFFLRGWKYLYVVIRHVV